MKPKAIFHKLLICMLIVAPLKMFAQQPNSWQQKQSLTGGTISPRDGAESFSIGSKGYIIAGGIHTDLWEYDPDTDTWTQKADFGGILSNGTGFSIGNKGYICTGTSSPPNFDGYYTYPTYLFEYDPAQNTWTRKAEFPGHGRVSARSFTIGDKGYVGTGFDILHSHSFYGTYYQDLWEYNATTDKWAQKADFPGGPRTSAVGFSIDTIGYMGTGYYSTPSDYAYYNDLYAYNPATNSWIRKTDFAGTARANAKGFGIGGKGYVGLPGDLWEYDPSADNWLRKADFPGSSGYIGNVLTINSKAYIGFGKDYYSNTYRSDFWEFDPMINVWTRKKDLNEISRYNAVGFSIGEKGFIGLGGSSTGIRKKDFWEYDPKTNTWSQKADFGGIERSNAVAFSTGNKGYVGTGNSKYGNQKDFWEYDVDLNTWTRKADFGGVSRQSATGFSINNKGYIGTGDSYEYPNFLKDFWEYDPSIDVWTKVSDLPSISGRRGALSFSIGQKGYVVGGELPYPTTENDFWEYDPVKNVWTRKVHPDLQVYKIGFSISTKGYIGLGEKYGYHLNTFWEYDQDYDKWNKIADFPGEPRYGATSFSIGNTGYVGFGITYSANIETNDLWAYTQSDVLALKGIELSGVLQNNNILLRWTAIQELNVQKYGVERSSNGRNFINIGTANSKGNGTNNYTFTDTKPYSGINYYRIVSLDNEGKNSVSKTTSVNNFSAGTITLYPNPAKNYIYISINEPGISDAHIEIIDLAGKTLIEQSVHLNNGNSLPLNISKLAAGIYECVIRTKDNQRVIKFVR